ncbi:MAG: beta-lactamase family protein [Saprospiraceae bacterium]|nr:MAG: beta-lactamase [Bacteroidetes bacterium OLB9]MCO6462849.1 beta-lactamase family protein [Saprospiraceae bacterium]MCZ2338677.1 beta-lactamase family protein [Chitinophagales bacterium]
MTVVSRFIKILKSVIVVVTFILAIVFSFNSCHSAEGRSAYYDASIFSSYPKIDTAFNRILDERIKEKMNIERTPGLAIAVIKDDRIIFEKEYGVRSRSSDGEIDPNTIFRIGSLSKGFAGILAAKLVEQNMISLEDPVSMYYPEFTAKGKNADGVIRIKHILSHSTGFTEHAFSNLLDQKVDINKIYSNLERLSPRDSTGIAYAYQNVIFAIIEKVIEKATGMSYADALQDYIFSPLSMCNSSCTYEDVEGKENVCSGHRSGRYGFYATPVSTQYYCVASAGGVNASLKDMERWLSAMMGNDPDIVSDEARNLAFQEMICTSIDRKAWNRWPGFISSHYGLGWRLIKTQQNNLVYHGGMVNGFRAEIAFDRDKKIGIIALFNSVNKYSNYIVPEFYDLWNTYYDAAGAESIL